MRAIGLSVSMGVNSTDSPSSVAMSSLPTFTRSSKGPTFTTSQLVLAASAALLVYLLFVFVQTVRHRDYFLPPGAASDDDHAARPTGRQALSSVGLLMLCLAGVVGLAKVDTPLIESVVSGLGLPYAAVAVVIALLVLLPESVAAIRAAQRGRFQTSVNLAYGSAMASIGLTIPTIAVLSWLFDYHLVLGLGPTEIVLLAITVVTGILTVTPGRATLLHGGIHLSIFAAFLVLAHRVEQGGDVPAKGVAVVRNAVADAAAERIAATCLSRPLVSAVEVTVHKPQASMPVVVTDICVTITRRSSNAR